MSKKFYFRTENDECCYTLEYHLIDAKDEGLTEIELFEAEKETVEGMFYCREADAQTEEGFCGKQCEGYDPRNGKSGMCKHKQNHFYTPGKKVSFKV